MSTTTVALVGGAHIHTPGFVNAIKKRSDSIKVKAVWDPNPKRAEVRAADLGATVVTDVNAIWSDREVKAAIICSETDRHEALVLPAVAAKKDLFVEKPLGMGSADGYRMADAIEKAGVRFQTGYFQRGDPKNLFLKDAVQRGWFGKITRVRGSNCHGGALGGWFDAKPNDVANDWRWMADPKVGGVGAFGDLGTHALDVLLWWIGDVTSATAGVDVGTNRYAGCDETGEGLMRFKNGAIGTLAASWDDLADPLQYLISGTEGHAAVIGGQLHFTARKEPKFDGSTPVRKAELPDARPAGFEAFLDAITGKPATLVGAREAAYRSSVIEAMYAGAKDGKWVAPK